MSPLLHSYIETLGLPPPPKTVVGSFSMPLVFEPGTSWAYSPGIDWAGLALARLTQTSLDTYLQQHVFGPIGIDDMTFWPDKTPALALRKSTLAMRDANGSGKAVPFLGPNPVAGATEELGGQGLFAPAKSYLKVLKSILTDDEVLLKKSSTALMFTPQLTAESQAVLQALYKSQPARGPCAVGEFPPDLKYDWGISGVLSLEDREKDGALVRRKGCLNWSGMLNLFWVSAIITWHHRRKFRRLSSTDKSVLSGSIVARDCVAFLGPRLFHRETRR
jgi:CubicO group peptidase (beta-lactamase class C family)